MVIDVHHINIVVRDLDQAISQYSRLLGYFAPIRERLPSRGVETARYRIGPTWLVLVMPTDPGGIAGRHLAQHGEGVSLLSFRVEDLNEATGELRSRGVTIAGDRPRTGLANWHVQDVSLAYDDRLTLQLCEES